MSHSSPTCGTPDTSNDHESDAPLSGESDFSDFESDECDEENDTFNAFQPRTRISAISSSSHRGERIRELTATELEYIHDLEILLDVTTGEGTVDKYSVLDMKTILGNIVQVIDVARRFSQELKVAAHHKEDEMIVGKVFLQFVEELTQVYKVYCSSYNVDVLPLLKKYENEENTTAALKQLAEELRSRKQHLLDLNCVLIKPVQRFLKYPLYLYELVQATPDGHEDYHDLEEAKKSFLIAAKDINEYTRAMDQVHNYRDDDHSLRHKMRHMKLHSLARKSARVTRKISQKFGVPHDKVLHSEIKELGIKFQCIQKSSEMLIKNVTSLTEALRSRHTAELVIGEMLVDIFPESVEAREVKASAFETCMKVLKMFDSEVQKRVLHPARQIMILCEGPASIFQKTRKILVDYDITQLKLQAALEPSRIASVVEESAQIRNNYEALSKQLVAELPVFIENAVAILTLCTKSLISARMYLQGHLAKLCLQLAQVQGINYMSTEEAQTKAKERVDYLLLLLPDAYQKKHLKKKDPAVKKIEKSEQVELRSKSQDRGGENSRTSAPAEFFKSFSSISKARSRSYPVNSEQTQNQVHEPFRTVTTHGHSKHWSRSHKIRQWKSLFSVAESGEAKPEVKSLKEQYSKEALYRVIEDHQAEIDNELNLRVGDMVAVLQKKDPMGGDRWVVDNGEKIGIVRKACLQLAQDNENGIENSAAPSNGDPVANTSPNEIPQDNAISPVNQSTLSPSDSEKVPPSLAEPFMHQTADIGSPSHDNLSESSDEWCDEDLLNESLHHGTVHEVRENTGEIHSETHAHDPHLKRYVVLYDFAARDSSQLSVKKSQIVVGIHTEHSDWWYVKDYHDCRGYVPATYLVEQL